MSSKHYVIKRNGKKQVMLFDKITARMISLANMNPKLKNVDPVEISKSISNGLPPGISTYAIDELAAETAMARSTEHYEYGLLAARIAVSNNQKRCPKTFSESIEAQYHNKNPSTGEPAPLIDTEIYEYIKQNSKMLDNTIDHSKDFLLDYVGFKTLQKSYFAKVNKEHVETWQYLIMRTSIGIFLHQDKGKPVEERKDRTKEILEYYDLRSRLYFTPATPTLFNAGTCTPQMSSCFTLGMKDDSIDGIYETLKRCALISKSAGGIGLSVHNIRASHSYIAGTSGYSNGLVPMLRVFNDTARYVDQGGGKRKGAFAIYLEPWHADIEAFLQLKLNNGKEEARARDLFYALWIPDLFMKRVDEDGDWCLFCPNECKGLGDTWGKDFEALYQKYEQEGKVRKRMKARELWFQIVDTQTQTGGPYMLYKDAANAKSNQQNLGTIKTSNLCTEILQYTSPDEVSVCNLHSIALPKYYKKSKGYDFQRLYKVVKIVTVGLNAVIDGNFYPIPEAERSNRLHRPIGIGVQGLADLFIAARLPWDHPEARRLNREIFETIYFGAMEASMELAMVDGPYPSYQGSPVSKGILQFDMWGVTPTDRWDWEGLRQKILIYGVRNSLLVAPMPTASTSQILCCNECFEPYTSNYYVRKLLSGEFPIINKALVDELMQLGLWSENMKQRIISDSGSIQLIDEIPQEIKDIYKTVWEISQQVIIDMAADRGAYICQSQSMNLFIDLGHPKVKNLFQTLTSMHFYAWKKGLKTGMYYLRLKQQTEAIKFTIDRKIESDTKLKKEQREEKLERKNEAMVAMFGENASISTSGSKVSTSEIKESTGFYNEALDSEDEFTEDEFTEEESEYEDSEDQDITEQVANVLKITNDEDGNDKDPNNGGELFCRIGCTTCGS